MSKSGNPVDYEINKSLDELVNEDQALSRNPRSGSHSKPRDRDEHDGRYE